MRKVLYLCALFVLFYGNQAASQNTLYYRYGDEGTQSVRDEKSDQLRQGLNQIFGGGNSGAIGGAIGTGVPDTSVSQQILKDEHNRKEALENRWAALNQSVPIDPKAFLDNYNERKLVEGMLKYKADGNPDDLANWKSSDPAFKRRAAEILYKARSTNPTTPELIQLKSVSQDAILLADDASSRSDKDATTFYFSVAQASVEILLAINPVTGTLQAVYEAVTGNNLITGVELTDFERGVAIFGVVTLGFSGEITKGVQLFNVLVVNGVKDTKLFAKAISYAKFVAGKFTFFRKASPIEAAAPRFIKILVEAGSGPSQRAEKLMAAYETVETGAMRIHPELYRLNDDFVMNLSLGEATRGETEILGQAFVGEGATISDYRQDPSVKTYRSADGRRGYRQPIWKKGVKRYQANFEVFAPLGENGQIIRAKALSDAHLNIK
ncbi:Rhs family protein [Paraburkholderia hospita]|uniref:Rhs family protein n=1 Tax=Paraburkholderia hospita TaxID=169430 RepID=A0ABN0FR46_9BURK|nr:pre-toxin TG domain-containing protein [Paraburkholderia hospita]EIN01320.1 Rhs family protein [Paraburkholderia hospita]OUL87557.1 hypothetical protein CA602_13675 [Paraburkholderia hospita]